MYHSFSFKNRIAKLLCSCLVYKLVCTDSNVTSYSIAKCYFKVHMSELLYISALTANSFKFIHQTKTVFYNILHRLTALLQILKIFLCLQVNPMITNVEEESFC